MCMKVDELELCRMFSSKDFLIPTRQIFELSTQLEEWIRTNSCGGIVYGPSRAGKSSAITYISNTLKKSYCSELPVYIYTATDHVATQKAFYESLLMALEHPEASKGTTNQMRQRLITYMTMAATNTKYQLACLFIDEAYLLTPKEFTWLCDLYNALNINNIQLTVILVGTHEILDVKKGFIRANKQQIVQRFMLKEAEFRGIESLKDLMICLNSLDNNFIPKGFDSPICLSQTYFPDAYLNGKTLVSYAKPFWDAVQNLRKANDINENYLTMKCFMDTVSDCLRKYGAQAGENKVFEPSVAEWEASL